MSKGALWKNKRKQSAKQPDFTGVLETPDGLKLFVSGWLQKNVAGGRPDIQLVCQEHRDQSSPKDDAVKKQAIEDGFDDDDIPF